jgi:pimeloyl-ACP methyl ester carboxylesterase
MGELPNVVLVHGAWADGSCWTDVIADLQPKGYEVVAPQFPQTSVEDDVARLRQVLNRLDGPTVLAGHSYGGHVITALGDDAPNVIGMVYVAAFGCDEGESLGALLSQGPPTPATANLIVDAQGCAWLPEDDFVGHFAADVDPARACASRGVSTVETSCSSSRSCSTPAWKSQPTWFLVATNDEAIPPDAQRLFASRMGATTVEVESGHLAMITHADKAMELIEQAAKAA